MKSLTQFIQESLEAISHKKGNGNGEFRSGDNYLAYDEDIVSYPEPIDDAIEISTLFVKNRRHGIGTELVKALIKYAKDSGFKHIVVFASPMGDHISEKDLIEFYTKLGFKHDDRVKDSLPCMILDL